MYEHLEFRSYLYEKRVDVYLALKLDLGSYTIRNTCDYGLMEESTQ